jgi:hypothetical protein
MKHSNSLLQETGLEELNADAPAVEIECWPGTAKIVNNLRIIVVASVYLENINRSHLRAVEC